MPHKSCQNRTVEMTPMKSVYCEVKRLSRNKEMRIPRKIHVGVFHYDATGVCKHHHWFHMTIYL